MAAEVSDRWTGRGDLASGSSKGSPGTRCFGIVLCKETPFWV